MGSRKPREEQQHQQPRRCSFGEIFRHRMDQQQSDLRALVEVRNHHQGNERAIRQTISSVLQHYFEYCRDRKTVATHNSPAVCTPACSSSFANSYLWFAGCRPTLIIRLVYVMAGEEAEAHLSAILGGSMDGEMVGLSAQQLKKISELHSATVRLEDGLSKKMASLQETMADQPLVGLARVDDEVRSATQMKEAMEVYTRRLAELMEAEDKLRLDTLAETMKILSLTQGLELLIVAAQLHTCVVKQGQIWDRMHAPAA